MLELLKIKLVQDKAANSNNEALCFAVNRQHWSVVIELLKNEMVKHYLYEKDHDALRTTLKVRELGIASLMMDFYKENYLDIPEDLAFIFKTQSEALLAKNIKMDCMTALITDIYKENGASLLQLLDDKNIQPYAARCNNLALLFAARNGLDQIVLKLLEIKEVRDNVAYNDNEALRIAATNGHSSVVSILLKLEPVRSLAAAKANVALFNSVRLGHWLVALELLKVKAVKKAIIPIHIDELLWRSLINREFKVALYLNRAIEERGLPIRVPCQVTEVSARDLDTTLKRTYQDAAGVMRRLSYDLINIVFEFAGLPTWTELEPTPVVAPTLLLSGGLLSDFNKKGREKDIFELQTTVLSATATL